MPTNRTRRLRNQKKISAAAIAYLSDDKTGIQENSHDAYTLWSFQYGFKTPFEDHKPEELWQQYRDEFLPEFIKNHPGKRPCAWWQWDAPRKSVAGWDNQRWDSAQRKRLGGTGTPMHEVSCSWGGFEKGIPISWVSEEHKKIGFGGEAVSSNDPPCYESEAAFLLRHGLLTASETRYIEKNPSLLEPVKVEFTEDEEE